MRRSNPLRPLSRRTVSSVALAGAVLMVSPAFAQSDTIRLYVGYTAGGPVDTAARWFAQALEKEIGKTVIVENKPGSGGSIAADQVSKAPGNGQVLFFGASPTMTITPHLQKIAGFDPTRDLIPIAPVLSYANVLVVSSEQPIKTVAELLAYGKANPNKITYGSAGVGASNHLSGELLAQRTRVQMRHIPYKGNTPAMTDVIGGQITMMFDIIGNARSYIAAGRTRPLAVTSSERNAALPDAPTMMEAGVPDYDVAGWFGVFGPSSLPADLVARYNAAAVKALAQPDFAKRLSDGGYDVWSGSAQALGERTAKEYRLWGTVSKGIKFE